MAIFDLVEDSILTEYNKVLSKTTHWFQFSHTNKYNWNFNIDDAKGNSYQITYDASEQCIQLYVHGVQTRYILPVLLYNARWIEIIVGNGDDRYICCRYFTRTYEDGKILFSDEFNPAWNGIPWLLTFESMIEVKFVHKKRGAVDFNNMEVSHIGDFDDDVIPHYGAGGNILKNIDETDDVKDYAPPNE